MGGLSGAEVPVVTVEPELGEEKEEGWVEMERKRLNHHRPLPVKRLESGMHPEGWGRPPRGRDRPGLPGS